MKKTLITITFLFCFLFGAYVWKILHTRHSINRTSELRRLNIGKQQILVEIEGVEITKADVNFEYAIFTGVLEKDPDITSVPDFGDKIDEELGPLKVNILNSIVERKILYHAVKADPNFDLSNSKRFVGCLEEWMSLKKEGAALFSIPENQNRMKSRLCENSILKQYVSEIINNKIQIDENFILEYFKNHREEFTVPAMVEISQIVLADEKKAKHVRARVMRSNFAKLARTYSITPEAENGGKLAPFPMGFGMPRFFEVAFTMRTGQISSILKSTYGFHIILLNKKIKSRVLSFNEASEYIRKKLSAREEEKAYNKWVETALHSIKVSKPKMYW